MKKGTWDELKAAPALSLLTNQNCSLNAPRAAVEAALAAAVCTVLLDMTPVANSCWAFSKLAPVVRYSP